MRYLPAFPKTFDKLSTGLWLWVFTIAFPGISQSNLKADNESWREVIQAMSEERSRFRSGEFTATGLIYDKSTPVAVEFELAGLFDAQNNSFLTKQTRTSEVKTSVFLHSSSPEYSAFYSTNHSSNRLSLGFPEATTLSAYPKGFAYLDPRAIGLSSFHDLFSGKQFSQAIDIWSDGDRISSTKDGVTNIQHYTHGGQSRVTLSINVHKGHTIERQLVDRGKKVDGEFKLNSDLVTKVHLDELNATGVKFELAFPDVLSDIRVSWRKMENVWVPIQLDIEGHELPQSSNDPQSESKIVSPKFLLSLEFEWTQINQPINPLLFQVDYFDLPRKLNVMDFRSDPPAYLGKTASTIPHPLGQAKLLNATTFGIFVILAGSTLWLLARMKKQWNERRGTV